MHIPRVLQTMLSTLEMPRAELNRCYISALNFNLTKNSFINNYTLDIFLFVTATISLVVTSIVMYIICRHTKLKSLVISLALQQIREVGIVAKQEHVSIMHDVECICKTQ